MTMTGNGGNLQNAGRLEALVGSGIISPEQLEEALAERERTHKSVVRALLDLGHISEDRLPEVLARWKGLEVVDLHEHAVDPGAAELVPESLCRRHSMVPIGFEGDTLVVALADPTNVIVLDDLQILTGREVKAVAARVDEIEETLNRLGALDRSAERILEKDTEEEKATELRGAGDEAPIVKAVNRILTQAVQQRASDVHVEPEEHDMAIRYRIDGVLHEVMRVPKTHRSGVISRLKVMADADIAETRIPQDGRTSISVDGKPVDLRVSTLPSVWGEEITIRILDRSASLLSLEELGYSPDALERYMAAVQKPRGMVLVTGPTGSGKSTTLYASLNAINDRSKKIVTVEDPVEYRMDGLRQLQTHPAIDLTFANALRSILRSDPDVIMIGEIRDRETAGMAVQAAMTGHLVLSTLHTNDAPTALTRLIEMGVEPFLIASAVDCVLAQRLARRLCSRCAETYKPKRATLREAGFPVKAKGPIPELRRAVGCRYCAETGYRGRVALTEVMPISEELEHLTVERAPSERIRTVATTEGMRALLDDGMGRVAEGITTLEEVLRVVA